MRNAPIFQRLLLISLALPFFVACSDDTASPDAQATLDSAVDSPSTVIDSGADTNPTLDTAPAGDSTVDTVDCECRPADGPCCDGCFFYTLTDAHACESVKEFKCEDTACGSDALERVGEKLCQGFTAECTGDQAWGDWTTSEACDDDSLCVSTDSASAACSTCAHSCGDGACWAECDPTAGCCMADGTLCLYGCNSVDDTCWADCDPANDPCCDADGTTCDHGCDTAGSVLAAGTCWADCDPSGSCCASNGTFLPQSSQDVKQPNANLMWYRCKYGEVWNPQTCQCTGTYQKMGWIAASPICINLGPAYRMPTVLEVRSLMNDCVAVTGGWDCTPCPHNTNCRSTVGPLEEYLWTSSFATSTTAWRINMDRGDYAQIRTDPIATERGVLCVRAP